MGYQLAARLLALPTRIIPNGGQTGGPGHVRYLSYAGTGAIFGGTMAAPDATGPFPYGLEVEPP